MRRYAMACAGMIVAASVLSAGAAHADASSCTAAHVAGQREMKAGRLKAALASYQECGSDESCPQPVRNECLELFASTEEALPTLVFSVLDEHGKDLTKVRVFWSGEPLAEALDGRPIAVDPGVQSFSFELPSGNVLSTELLVHQGEKNRLVTLQDSTEEFAALARPAPVAKKPLVESTVPELEASSPRSHATALWVASAVGVTALGSWGVLSGLARHTQSELMRCAPDCDPRRKSDYDGMKRNYLIADVSLGVAVVSAIVIAALLTARHRRTADSERALLIRPIAFSQGGGLAMLSRRY